MFALLLLACSSEISVTPDQGGCVDFSYADPGIPEVSWVPQGAGALVTRDDILLQQSGATFAPEVELDGTVLSLREYWVEPESDDQFCYTASVLVENFGRKLEVRWFVEDEPRPYQTVILTDG